MKSWVKCSTFLVGERRTKQIYAAEENEKEEVSFASLCSKRKLPLVSKAMAAIRHSLQQELFRPNDEALYSVVNVAKVGGGKKKKTSFLCAAGINFSCLYSVCNWALTNYSGTGLNSTHKNRHKNQKQSCVFCCIAWLWCGWRMERFDCQGIQGLRIQAVV